MGQSLQQTRIAWIDAAKAFAIFLIVLGHALRDGTIHTYVFSFHVPMFLMLAGLVFHPDQYHRFLDFLKAKTRTILIPYLVFALISVAIFLLLGKQVGEELSVDAHQSWWECLIGVFYGNHQAFSMKFNLPLWYLPCLFVIEWIFYGLSKLPTRKELVISVSAVGFLLLALMNYYGFHIVGLPLDPETVVTLAPFFAVGMLLQNASYFMRPQGQPWADIGCGVLLIVLGMILGMANGFVAYTQDIYGTLPLFYLGAFLSSGGWMMVLRRLPTFQPVSFVGQSTLAILVMHKFPIVLFQAKIPVLKDLLRENQALVGVFVSVVAILLCLAAQWVIVRIVPFALGRVKDKNREEKINGLH